MKVNVVCASASLSERMAAGGTVPADMIAPSTDTEPIEPP